MPHFDAATECDSRAIAERFAPIGVAIARRKPAAADGRAHRAARRVEPSHRPQPVVATCCGGLPQAVPAHEHSQAARCATRRARARGRARRLRRQGRDQGHPSRSGRDAVRAGAGARHKSSRVDRRSADDIARSMSAASARVADGAGPQRHRHRVAQCAARDRASARAARIGRLAHTPKARCPLVLGKIDRRRSRHRRSGAHAASAGGRHDRLGQVRRRQLAMILSLLYRLRRRNAAC